MCWVRGGDGDPGCCWGRGRSGRVPATIAPDRPPRVSGRKVKRGEGEVLSGQQATVAPGWEKELELGWDGVSGRA